MHYALTLYIIFQSLLFAIALISRRKPENSPLVLYFIYLLLKNLFVLLVSGYWGSYFSDKEFLHATYEFISHCMPVVVFYFLYSILEKPLPKPLQWLGLLPVLNLGIHYTFKAFGMDLYKANFYDNWYSSFPLYTKILLIILLVWHIQVFRKEIAENGASKKHSQLIKLYWGKYFIYFNISLLGFLVSYLAFTLANGRLWTISSSFFIYSEDVYEMIYYGFTVLFFFVFGYMALRNPLVFNTHAAGSYLEHSLAEIVLPQEEKQFQKKIELTEEQSKQYTLILNKLMENDKVYLDPELSLSHLAKLSGIPSRQLSQFIQLAFHKKYTEYINTYRIIHAQKLLAELDAARYTTYSIAFDSGFNSESYFCTIFKQQTGLTPKQYQDKFKNQQ